MFAMLSFEESMLGAPSGVAVEVFALERRDLCVLSLHS